MTTTKSTEKANQRRKEERASRIKRTNRFIKENGLTGVLNNQKWSRILDYLDRNKIAFEFKTLLGNEKKKSELIRELEDTSFLPDDSGEFIEFLEIEWIRFQKKSDSKAFPDNQNIEYLTSQGYIEIDAYCS